MRKALLLWAAAAGLLTAQPQPSRDFFRTGGDGSATMEYQVKEGETLFHIAERFTGDPYKAEALAKANSISDPLRVPAGMRIRVPSMRAAILYSIERFTNDGEIIEHSDADRMKAGDRFVLRVSANVPGYLYAFNASEVGMLKRIYPSGQRAVAIRPFTEYRLPPASYFRLDAEKGKGAEEVWIVVTRQPVSELDALVDGGLMDTGSIQEMTRTASSAKGIVVGREGDQDDSGEYVTSTGDSRFLIAYPIKIRRRQ